MGVNYRLPRWRCGWNGCKQAKLLLGQATAPSQHTALIRYFDFLAQEVEEHHSQQVHACDAEEIFSTACRNGKEAEHPKKLIDEMGDVSFVGTGPWNSGWHGFVQAVSVDQWPNGVLATFPQRLLIDQYQVDALPLFGYGIDDALVIPKLVPKDNRGDSL
jgi:hypothetical protein